MAFEGLKAAANFVGRIIGEGTLWLLLVRKIGTGGFSTVFLANELQNASQDASTVFKTRPATTGRVFAVKVISTTDGNGIPRAILNMHGFKEAQIHSRASDHENVATLHRTIFGATFVALVLPYFPEGDLFGAIASCVFVGQPDRIVDVMLQIAAGVEWCHEQGIYNRDLKPENILVSDGGRRVFLTDFGLATTEVECTEFGAGSANYMAPEAHGPRSYNTARADIFALGIILLNLLVGRMVWGEARRHDLNYRWFFRSCNDENGESLFFLTYFPVSMQVNHILRQILHPKPSSRISVQEIADLLRAMPLEYRDWMSELAVFIGSRAYFPWEKQMKQKIRTPSVQPSAPILIFEEEVVAGQNNEEDQLSVYSRVVDSDESFGTPGLIVDSAQAYAPVMAPLESDDASFESSEAHTPAYGPADLESGPTAAMVQPQSLEASPSISSSALQEDVKHSQSAHGELQGEGSSNGSEAQKKGTWARAFGKAIVRKLAGATRGRR